MKLFWINRFGNPDSPDKSNGEDTHFLVRARDHVEAAMLADAELDRLPHPGLADYSNVVREIGVDEGSSDKPQIVLGPVVQWAWGSEYPTWWKRESKDQAWIKFEGELI